MKQDFSFLPIRHCCCSLAGSNPLHNSCGSKRTGDMVKSGRIAGAIALLTLGISAAPSQARATTIDDPLHGFCGSSASSSSCTDNGTITSFSSLTSFGFYASPDALTGTDWLIAILVPTNISNAGSMNFTVNETAGAGNNAKTNVA